MAANDVAHLLEASQAGALSRDEALRNKSHGDLMLALSKRDEDTITGADDDQLAGMMRGMVDDEIILQWAAEIKAKARG